MSENRRPHHDADLRARASPTRGAPLLNFFIERYAEAFDAEIDAFVEAVETGRPAGASVSRTGGGRCALAEAAFEVGRGRPRCEGFGGWLTCTNDSDFSSTANGGRPRTAPRRRDQPGDRDALGEAPVATPPTRQARSTPPRQASKPWRATPAFARADACTRSPTRWFDAAGEAASMISSETGKPIAQSQREWGLAVDQFRWYAEEARRIYGRIVESRVPGGRFEVSHEPVGVVAAFTAWNFPAALSRAKSLPRSLPVARSSSVPRRRRRASAMVMVDCCRRRQSAARRRQPRRRPDRSRPMRRSWRPRRCARFR